MLVRSLACRTDLIFAAFEGQILDRAEYLVIRTPSNPTFYWGNYLLFPAPPGPADLDRWRALFAREIGNPAQVQHMAFGWDGVDGAQGEVAPFLEAGFQLNQDLVLTAQAVHPPARVNRDVEIRPIEKPWEWEEVLQNQIRCRDAQFSLDGYTVFKERQMAGYQAMVRAGLGHWFGAFLGEQLVADLGCFAEGEIGRFQSVETHPDFRRRGICGSLVVWSAHYAFAQMGVETLVMVADEHYHAARIYESVGFTLRERRASLEWSVR